MGFHLQPEISNSNRSSIIQTLESSKSSNILTSDEESSNIQIKGNKISTPLTLVKKSRRKFKFKRSQTCPAVLRKKKSYESAHQSISDKGLKLIFPRKRSIRTTLKDVLSSPKRKRKLIEYSNKNSGDVEDSNFIDFCSRNLEMRNDGFRQEKPKETIQDKNIKEMMEDNNFEETTITDSKSNEVSLSLKTSILKIGEDKTYIRNVESSSSFQDRALVFDRKLNLMAKYFQNVIRALHESIIVKQERESGEFNIKGNTIATRKDKLDKREVSELLGKMEEIVDVGTNDDAKKNEKAPEPGVERKVDRFRNLLEKISMLRGDVTILLEDAEKNDKTLEFLRYSRNFSRSSHDEARKGSVNREDVDGKLVENTIVNQSLAAYFPKAVAQNMPQNRPQSDQTVSQITPQNEYEKVAQHVAERMFQNTPQIVPQNSPPTESHVLPNITQSESQTFSQISPQIEPHNLIKNISQNVSHNVPQIDAKNLNRNLHESLTKILTQHSTQNADKNLLNSRKEAQSKFENKSIIDEDDVQILKIIRNNDRSRFLQSETNHLDGDYHFLLSLHQQLTRMPQGRKLKMRLKMQQLFYEEICTIDSD